MAGGNLARSRFLTGADRFDQGAQQAQDFYLSGMQGFDPRAAFKEYRAGALADTKDLLGRELSDLAGRAAGSGRLNTGFYDMDAGDVTRNVLGDFNNRTAQAALQTSGQRLNQLQGAGNYSINAGNTALEAYSGELDRQQAEENAKRKRRGGLLGGIGAVLGAGVGSVIPGVGTYLGAELGGLLGGGAGEYFG